MTLWSLFAVICGLGFVLAQVGRETPSYLTILAGAFLAAWGLGAVLA